MKHLFDSLSNEYNETSMSEKIIELKTLIKSRPLLSIIEETTSNDNSKYLALIDYLNETLEDENNSR